MKFKTGDIVCHILRKDKDPGSAYTYIVVNVIRKASGYCYNITRISDSFVVREIEEGSLRLVTPVQTPRPCFFD